MKPIFPLLVLLSCGLFAQKPASDSLRITVTEGTNMAAAVAPGTGEIALSLQGTVWLLPTKGGVARPLTDSRDDAHQPAWSPDGKRIFYFAFRDGTYHLWSIGREGRDLRQHTSGEFDEREPHGSPDGKKLVFVSDRNRNYDVWELDLTTHQTRALTTNPGTESGPTYSPDGTRIAYASNRPEAPGLYVLEGGRERLVWASAAPLGPPAWSADGQTLFLQVSTQGQTQLVAKALAADAPPRILSAADEDVFPFRPGFGPDGRLVYVADGVIKRLKIGVETGVPETVPFSATVSLWRKPYVRKTYDFDSQNPRPVKGLRGPTVSPDGTRIAFAALGDLYVLTLGNPRPEALTHDAFVEADPAWSPDGKFLAYVSDRSGVTNLWLRDLASGEDRPLTRLPDEVYFPAFSPDGKRLAFYTSDPRNAWGRGTLHVLDLPASEDQPFPIPKKIHESLFAPGLPGWSPDGKFLAVASLEVYSSRFREGLNEFLLIPVDGSGTDQHLKPAEGQSFGFRGRNGPAWCPDGTQVAYVMDGTLWTLPVTPEGRKAGQPRQRTSTLADNLSWTGDGKSLFFSAIDTLKRLDLATGRIEAIPLDFQYGPEIPTQTLVIHAGKMFDGKTNGYRENVDILVENHRIRAIEPHRAGRPGRLLDASGLTVLPGLFEMHTHQTAFSGEKLGRLWLSYGITSLRETGSDPYDALERREAWASGVRPGPREFFTGNLNEGIRLYYGLATSIRSEGQLRLELDRARRLDYDLFKTYVRLPDRLQQLATTLAHGIGIPVSSHEIYPASQYNVDAVEHASGTSRRGYSPKLSGTSRSYDDVRQIVARSGMNITPTISLSGGFFYQLQRDTSLVSNRQFRHFFSETYRNSLEVSRQQLLRLSPGAVLNFKNLAQHVKRLLDAGARVTTGTDSPFVPYGLSLHVELQNWVEGGATPFEALRGATSWAAEHVGVGQDLGTLEPGKLADFSLVLGDPLRRIQDAMNVRYTVKNGRVYSLEELLK